MPRQAKREDRLPSQRDPLAKRSCQEEVERCDAIHNAAYWEAWYWKVCNDKEHLRRQLDKAKRRVQKAAGSPQSAGVLQEPSRDKTVAKRQRTKNKLRLDAARHLLTGTQLAAITAREAAAEAAQEAADAARAAAAEQEQQARAAVAELMAAQLLQRRVHLKLQGRLFDAVRSQSVAVSPEPPLAQILPAGCRLLTDAVPQWMVNEAAEQLEQLFNGDSPDPRVTIIKAGQKDEKRRQLTMASGELPILKAYTRVLRETGEAHGRKPSEFNAIRSSATCTRQKTHWDYDPNKVRYRKRKPCSAILALSEGARLYVYDQVLKREVTVVVPPGAILLFDGDVPHAGASYAAVNTRIHVYLDVTGVDREPGYTWEFFGE